MYQRTLKKKRFRLRYNTAQNIKNMRFYFETSVSVSKEAGKLRKVGLRPDTNNKFDREVFVLIAKEIDTLENGQEVSFGLVGAKKTPMVFPHDSRKSFNNNDIIVLGNIKQPGHRLEGTILQKETTAIIINEASGGGAWGSGTVFLAKLRNGERVVSSDLTVWLNDNGNLVKKNYETLAEYEIDFGDPEILFI